MFNISYIYIYQYIQYIQYVQIVHASRTKASQSHLEPASLPANMQAQRQLGVSVWHHDLRHRVRNPAQQGGRLPHGLHQVTQDNVMAAHAFLDVLGSVILTPVDYVGRPVRIQTESLIFWYIPSIFIYFIYLIYLYLYIYFFYIYIFIYFIYFINFIIFINSIIFIVFNYWLFCFFDMLIILCVLCFIFYILNSFKF